MQARKSAVMGRGDAVCEAQGAGRKVREKEFDDALGLERVDLAWKKTIEREKARNLPTFPAMKREMANNRALKAYSQAIGVSAV